VAEDLLQARAPTREEGAFVGKSGRRATGRGDQVTFTAASRRMEHFTEDADAVEIAYRLREVRDASGTTLALMRREVAAGQPEGRHRFSAMARGIASLTLRYYDGEDWVDEFQGTETAVIPAAVEVIVTCDGESEPVTGKRVIVPFLASRASAAGSETGEGEADAAGGGA